MILRGTGSPDAGRSSPGESSDSISVREFVRTPFAVRCNVVKFWRQLPPELWTALSESKDHTASMRAERRALAGVAITAAMLLAVFSGFGTRASVGELELCFPLLGWSSEMPAGGSPIHGWYYAPGQSLSLVLWTVGPSLAGWAFVRLFWLPLVATAKPKRAATLSFARHLGAVYLYVYLMVVGGAALMVPLVLLAPGGTETIRWYLWCFLFGESFFVPAAMWFRLVVHDRSGQVFGPHRYPAMALYATLFIVIPICGMVQELP